MHKIELNLSDKRREFLLEILKFDICVSINHLRDEEDLDSIRELAERLAFTIKFLQEVYEA